MTWPLKVITFAVACVASAAAATTRADPDLWGHTRFGLDTLATWALPADDPYSFTQDTPWINHEWLSELQMGAAYAALGPAGLAMLKGLLVVAGLWLVWSGLRGIAPGPRMVAMGVAVVGSFPLLQTLRPQLWSFVCVAILCRLLRRPDDSSVWPYPILFAVWANLHGGWIVGAGVVAVWFGTNAAVRPKARRRGALIVGSTIVATMLTPYGPTLWRFIAETVRLSRPAIEEWQPVWNAPAGAVVVLAAVVATAVWLVRRPFAHRLATLLVLGMLAVAGAKVARMTPLFVEVAVLLLAPAVKLRWPVGARHAPRPSRSDGVVAAVVLAAALVASVSVARSALACVHVDRHRMPEPEAVTLLEAAPAGRAVTFFNWGQYAIWHLGPRIRVSMDGRRETVYSDVRLAEHDAILAGSDEGLDVLEAWRPEYVWLPIDATRTRDWLVTSGYRIAFDGDRSFIAVRGDLHALARGSAPSAHRRACFPG